MKTQEEIKFKLEELKKEINEFINNDEISNDEKDFIISALNFEIKTLKWVLNEK